MKGRREKPVCLAVGGSDSGGGAGVQADVLTLNALGVHGTCAVTAVTAQNPKVVAACHPAGPGWVAEQMRTVFDGFHVRVCKTGMLAGGRIVREVSAILARHPRCALVVDPVLMSTSGRRLLDVPGLRALQELLLPRALLVTPNVPEAELLTGRRLREAEDLRAAARAIHGTFGCAAWVKGGHLPGLGPAVDIFYDGEVELLLTAVRTRGVHTHGTGCTAASAVAAFLALGWSLSEAVIRSKRYVTGAIRFHSRASGQAVLNWNW